MIEAFFNNEKTFSVFKYLLESNDYVSFTKISLDLKIDVNKIYKIINNFDLLDMIEYDSQISIKLDIDNPIVLSICILDELLEKYYMDNQKERIMENGDFQQVFDRVDLENASILDFVECLKKINK